MQSLCIMYHTCILQAAVGLQHTGLQVTKCSRFQHYNPFLSVTDIIIVFDEIRDFLYAIYF